MFFGDLICDVINSTILRALIRETASVASYKIMLHDGPQFTAADDVTHTLRWSQPNTSVAACRCQCRSLWHVSDFLDFHDSTTKSFLVTRSDASATVHNVSA